MALAFSAGVIKSQVKIGENVSPTPGTVLDLKSTVEGGLLLPKVNITAIGRIPADFTDASVQGQDRVDALAGMIVWNTYTGTDTSTGAAISPGVYMWDGDNWNLLKPASPRVPESIIVGSYKWATRNLTGSGAGAGTFVANISDPGMFYQFNRPTGWPSSGTVTGWNSTGDAGVTWETSNDPCPSGFHVPTDAQLADLDSQPNVWVDDGNSILGLNAKAGRIYGTSTPEDFDPSLHLFLPAAGQRISFDGSLASLGTNGYYWTDGIADIERAIMYAFDSGRARFVSDDTSFGISVRCVKN